MNRPIHYWTGYGNLCATADARKRNSRSSAKRKEVTCESCKTLLRNMDELVRALWVVPRKRASSHPAVGAEHD